MKTAEFTDPDGQKLPLLTIGYTKVFPMKGLEENFHKLQDLKFRDDDVVVTAYPRSGIRGVSVPCHMTLHLSSSLVFGIVVQYI